jgi:cobalamin biosynthesis Mg chelatase CobN
MNRVLVTGLLAFSMIVGLGCATRKYVRKQTEPLNNKVSQLEATTTQNSGQIKDLDARTQQSDQSMKASIDQANQKATDAAAQAQQAQQLATAADSKATAADSKAASAETKTTDLGAEVANLQTKPQQLPKTASPLPLIGLLGMLSLAGSFGLRALIKMTISQRTDPTFNKIIVRRPRRLWSNPCDHAPALLVPPAE